MKKIVRKPQREEREPVDVTNDAMMVAEGIRPANALPRDKSVWSKTSSEKIALRMAKARDNSKFTTRWGSKGRSVSVVSKLTFHVVPTKELPLGTFPKTTYSFNCTLSSIQRILSGFGNAVQQYYWNGKTYTTAELPFWGR